MQTNEYPNKGGADDVTREPSDRLDYALRQRKLDWRYQWWLNGRDADDKAMGRNFKRALDRKREMIKRQRETADHLAAYAAPPAAGSPWVTIGPRNINGRVKCLAVHPSDPQTLYAGSASGGVWKSTNGGESWDPLWDGEESLAIGALAIAPSNPNVIYAATGEWTPGWGPGFAGAGLFASTDAGATWTQHTGLVSRRVAQCLVSPTDANRVYVAGNSGFERSTDAGATWSTLRAGQISDAVIDASNANVIYLNVRNDGIYKTTDGGATWTLLGSGPTGANADWIRLAIGLNGAHGTDFVVAKRSGTLYTTTDGGTTWSTLAGSHGGVSYHAWCNLLAVAPDDENLLLAGGAGEYQRTTDGGASWANLSGLHADHHRAVFAPSSTSIVYSCNDGGLYRSSNKGATFEKVSDGLVITQFYDVGGWDSIGTVVGGGTQDQGTNFSHGGLTWKSLLGGDGGYFVVHPSNPRTMYAEYQNTAIRKTTDGGGSWVACTNGITGSNPWTGVITLDPNNPDRLFTGTQMVFRTTDGCATPWVQSSQSLSGSVTAIAVARSNPNRVYAATSSGMIIRSDDAGATNPWADKTAAPLPARTCKDVIVSDTNADRVLAVFGGSTGGAASHVFLSTNGGNSWTDISADLPDGTVNAAVFDPNAADTLYVGTDVGVFRTTDGGASWEAFDNGIPNVSISDLTVDPEDQLLVAATFGRGMYKVSVAPANIEPTVDLYLRDSVLDTGERFPTPSGLPNPTDPSDTVGHWESPDIKVEVTPYYSPDAVFDGVEFDTEVEHDDPYRDEVNRVYLQVHNRGYQTTTNVSVRLFFADASAGLPNLPNALTPPNFNLSSTVDWQPVGPAQTIAQLEPNRPLIVSWDFTVPAGAATHSCLLGVVSSGDDPITTGETNVETLHRNEKRVGLKNLHVINSPGPRPAARLVTLNFHNARDVADLIDIVIRPDDFSEGVIGMLVPKLRLRDADKALHGVTLVPLRENEFVGDWYVKPGDKPGEVPKALWQQLDRTRLYEFDAEKVSELRGIEIPAKGKLQALFTVRGTHNVPYGRQQRFSVMQRQGGRIIGGSTFELRLRRAKALHPVSRIRVILEKVRVLDDQDPCFKGRGEFQFNACVGFNDDACRRHFRRLPHCGSYKISDWPGCNEQVIETCLFDGFVAEEDRMTVALLPVEQDLLDPDDVLRRYRRIFNGPPETWVGRYSPGDEGQGDPEALGDWQVWYRIESVRF
ncbi:MAG: WD40/YVTN/BNR-like repeat-containing protein [Pseudomonas sp.]